MENAVFICSQSTSLHFCCHGYKNEAITFFRISYFYCNYTTGNYFTIFPFISPIVCLCCDASIACTEPPSTDLLLVGGCSLPWVWGLRGLSSAGQAAAAHGQEPTQQQHTAVTEPGTAGTHSQELLLVPFLPWNEMKCSCVAGGCSSLCLSVSAAQDHCQVCVNTASGKQNGGKNLLGC